MAFNVLEYLKEGKVDFVRHSTVYDYKSLINCVRKAPNRIQIINGFLPKLRETLPDFCFRVIYDIPEFADDAYKMFNIKKMTPEMLDNVLNNSPLGLKILYENFDIFLANDEKYFYCIVKYAFLNNNKELIHKLSRYRNLHIRYLFMEYLIIHYPEQIDIIYNDITKYTTSVTYEPNEQLTILPKLMDSEDISKLAVLLLTNNREEDYKKLKEFILKEYEYNHLAKCFFNDNNPSYINNTEESIRKRNDAFCEDANRLFKTSIDYQFVIYSRHNAKIKKELLTDFASRIKYFAREDNSRDLAYIYGDGLGKLLEEWTEKYMGLSKNKEYGYIGGGTTCNCYRIGDYVIKLIRVKWSYEDIICPNLYLIAKNYEEIYLRDEKGIVYGGLEVQKYLTRRADKIDPKYFRYFDLALNRLGYRRGDTLTKGQCGENTMLLDTYLDADTRNPERVPVWFRQYPLVLVDRDMIYPKDKDFVKQLSSGY